MERQDLGLLILRLGIGGYMASHGWGKLQMLTTGGFEAFGDPIGLGAPLSLALVTGAEFVCALLVMVGLFTRLAAVPVVITMAVAGLVAHGKDPWTMESAAKLFMAGQAQHWGSKEPALMYLTVFLALILTGPGRYSVDGWLQSRKSTEG